MHRFATVLLLVPLLACGSEPAEPPQAQTEATGEAAPDGAPELIDGLGSHSFPITTASPRAQRYFDQGLALTYGFNHDAAVRSFEEAARLDPECAMCWWGVGLALGPNINAPMGPEAGRLAFQASRKAQSLAAGATPREQAYIAALQPRYAAEPPEERAGLDRAYADAMQELHAAYPEDVDAATLLAEALMDLSPWNYWTAEAEPREHTAQVLALLEGVLERQPDHLGANHYYIHAVEEHFPQRAEPAADRLGSLAPGAGHLVHMPSHIYWRVGRYDDAMEINQRAAAADEEFFAFCRAGAFYRAAYYPHNVHFLWAAAAVEGRYEIAISSARKLAAATSDGLEAFPFLEEFQVIPVLTLLRFGRFDAVLGEPAPPPEHRYRTGIHHYARGVALARSGRSEEARAELASLETLRAEPEVEALILAGATASAAHLLGIGQAHLEGEIAAAGDDLDGAALALGRAVEQQDALVYMEPPPWYFPTRQALGAMLLQAQRAEEAEAVFTRDLEQYPENGWSLLGLSLAREAQGKDASDARRRFDAAWARADVPLETSRL